MKRWLPRPLLSVGLLAMWLILSGSWALSGWLLGVGLAVVIPLFTQRFAGPLPAIKRPFIVLQLAGIVCIDIVMSNIAVMSAILRPERKLRSAFVWVPLALTDANAKATLAAIVTMTPGTVSADFSGDARFLLVHALHVEDEATLIEMIKSRYEIPLMRIFQS